MILKFFSKEHIFLLLLLPNVYSVSENSPRKKKSYQQYPLKSLLLIFTVIHRDNKNYIMTELGKGLLKLYFVGLVLIDLS